MWDNKIGNADVLPFTASVDKVYLHKKKVAFLHCRDFLPFPIYIFQYLSHVENSVIVNLSV